MRRTTLGSRLRRTTVTDADTDRVRSLTFDRDPTDTAGPDACPADPPAIAARGKH